MQCAGRLAFPPVFKLQVPNCCFPISVRESSLGMPPLRDNALEGEPPQGVYANASSIEKLAANRQTRSIALAAITIAEQIGSRD